MPAHWLLKNLSPPHFLSNLQATFKSVLFLVFWSNSDKRRLLDKGGRRGVYYKRRVKGAFVIRDVCLEVGCLLSHLRYVHQDSVAMQEYKE